MRYRPWMAPIVAVLLSACQPAPSTSTSDADSASSTPQDAGQAPYVALDDDLTALIDDFNAHVGTIRQVYIVGPTCGICLRGMADMDRALVADLQDDPRLQTLVLHVPTMGAEERHVAPTIHLLQGPRVRHYWDGTGHSGFDFQEALDLPTYAWDVWLVYDPEATWLPGHPPPTPAFWQHQLGGLALGSRLQPDLFAAEVQRRMEGIDPASVVETAVEPTGTESLTGDLIRVEQPRGYVIQQHLTTRGGYHNLKEILRIKATATLMIGDESYPMTEFTDHRDRYRRQVQTDQGMVEVEVVDGVIQRKGPELLPADLDDAVLRAFEFDSWLMEWKDKGHQVWRLGMIRDGDRMPWLMELEHRNGQTWHVYLDSHTGDDYRWLLLDEEGDPRLSLEFDDFQETHGLRRPHAWRLSSGGEEMARVRYTDFEVAVSPDFDMTEASH